MIQTSFIIPLAATWRDLVPWIPILVIIMVLSAFGIVAKGRPTNPNDEDD